MPKLNKTRDQVLSNFITDGRANLPTMLWAQYTPEYDILYTIAGEISRLTLLLEYVRLIGFLDGYNLITDTLIENLATELEMTTADVKTLIEDDLDNFASMWLVNRRDAQAARGTWKLYFEDGTYVNVAKDTQFKTEGGKIYKLDEKLTNAVPQLVEGRYTVYAVLQADGTGTNYNVPSGTTITAVGTVSKFLSGEAAHHIYSGRDKESNAHFVTRIKELRQSRTVGSKSWIKALIETHDSVYDCDVYATGDEEFTRAPVGADAWVYCESSPEENTDTRQEGILYFEKQPLVDDIPVTTVGVTFVRDTGDDAYSKFANDYAEVPSSVSTVTYRTDSVIRTLQDMMNDSNYWIVGGRKTILVRRALRVKLNISFTYYIVNGYTSSEVEDNIEADLLKFFTGGTTTYGEEFARKAIAETTDKSDILGVIEDVDGVDRIDLTTFTVLREDGDAPDKDPIPCDFNEYHTLGNVDITLGSE